MSTYRYEFSGNIEYISGKDYLIEMKRSAYQYFVSKTDIYKDGSAYYYQNGEWVIPQHYDFPISVVIGQ